MPTHDPDIQQVIPRKQPDGLDISFCKAYLPQEVELSPLLISAKWNISGEVADVIRQFIH